MIKIMNEYILAFGLRRQGPLFLPKKNIFRIKHKL